MEELSLPSPFFPELRVTLSEGGAVPWLSALIWEAAGTTVQSFLRWLLLRMGWPLARGRPFAPPPAAASSPSELSVSSRSLRSSSTSFPVMNLWAMRKMR